MKYYKSFMDGCTQQRLVRNEYFDNVEGNICLLHELSQA
jgi:hypothetical protein